MVRPISCCLPGGLQPLIEDMLNATRSSCGTHAIKVNNLLDFTIHWGFPNMSTIHKSKPSSFSKGLFAASTPEIKGATLPLFSLPFCSWNPPQTEKLEGLVNPTNPYKRPTLLGPSPGVPSLHTLFKWIMSKLVLIEGKRLGKSWLLRKQVHELM